VVNGQANIRSQNLQMEQLRVHQYRYHWQQRYDFPSYKTCKRKNKLVRECNDILNILVSCNSDEWLLVMNIFFIGNTSVWIDCPNIIRNTVIWINRCVTVDVVGNIVFLTYESYKFILNATGMSNTISTIINLHTFALINTGVSTFYEVKIKI
jgi:hypothetical protein